MTGSNHNTLLAFILWMCQLFGYELESVDNVTAIMFNTKPNSNNCDNYIKFVSFYAKCFYFQITMDVYKVMLINILLASIRYFYSRVYSYVLIFKFSVMVEYMKK